MPDAGTPEADDPAPPSVTPCDDEAVDWCARARETPRSAQEVSWRAFLRPATAMPLEASAGVQRAGEPPPDRAPP